MPTTVELTGSGSPEPQILLAEEIKSIRSVLGPEIPESDILRALSIAGNNALRAINILLDRPELLAAPNPVKQEMNYPFLKEVKREEPGFYEEKDAILKSEERNMMTSSDGDDNKIAALVPEIRAKNEECEMGCGKNDFFMSGTTVKKEESVMVFPKNDILKGFYEWLEKNGKTGKVGSDEGLKNDEVLMNKMKAKEEDDGSFHKDATPTTKKESCEYDDCPRLAKASFTPYLNPRPISAIRPGSITYQRIEVPSDPDNDEGEEFLEEPDWFLVGRSYVPGLSTCRGKKKLEAGEKVHFSFPSHENMLGRQFVRAKTASAVSEIVRFSTKRCGEIGRLPPEWSRSLIPLVNSSKVKIDGLCVQPPAVLSLMQEITLYISFYIHISIFTKGNKFSWKLATPSHANSTNYPLQTLFRLVRLKPFSKADFTPAELDKRKRSLNLEEEDDASHIMGLAKRRRGGQTYPEQSKDEQAISESSLNKLVGAADEYNLEEAEPPSTLVPDLWPYQKQALYWMSESEEGIDVEQAAKTLHPCWSAYKIADRRASAVYVNVFSGEATTQFPSASQMARGGILADAMGLGKTVMTIALILARPNGERLNYPENMACQEVSGKATEESKPNNRTIKGGTLIVCPMALLGQWKDELETHSKPGTLSIFVHYGGDRTNDVKVISEHDVVLTTYGVLASAYKTDSESPTIFHRIDWYRVVLDEAHTIKSSKTRVAQSAFALKAYCRWCLTGTPLQNNLEDLYSLLCFLHVEPWCNWAWWHKLIQGPYESGDERGLRLVKAILRPLMLRRTKDSRDKNGRPILVLPPADIQIMECEQSEAEHDFYEALFRRSKVKFDQFVAQGKVLHNYASILELLLRLRQCCNHPFLVLSRGDTQQYADLNKLAHRFLEGNHSTTSMPTRAYVEEVVEGIRKGEVSECPICLESASDDPVLTPCAHRMCRECLLSSWRTPSGGPCPICRNPLTKADLITVPSESRFQVDVHNNWKESSKVQKLMECLKNVTKSGEKSIVFSQWTAFLDLVQIPLSRNRIGFLRFDGKLSQKKRESVLKEFSGSKDKPVLLMSLKAGGVGLNLTAASNVFLMDPWWNPAVEEQAIMRIHRIGQERQVRVRRFIVKDTVEERMQQVQARKQRMIAGALTDEEVRSARIEELKMLFR